MGIEFDPRDALSALVNTAATALVMSQGGTPEQAALAGALAGGTVTGVDVRRSYSKQLNATIHSVLKKVLDKSAVNTSIRCKRRLRKELLSDAEVKNYLSTADQLGLFKRKIGEICTEEHCEVTHDQIEQIANQIISELDAAILDNSDLTGPYILYRIKLQQAEIQENQRVLLEHIAALNTTAPAIRGEDTEPVADLNELSKRSAEEVACHFSSVLFADEGLSAPKTLADVYVETGFFDNNGIKYPDNNAILQSLSAGDHILIEGDAGIGKSTFVTQVANNYLSGTVFVGKIAFFVCGKDIRNSRGDAVKDIMKCIGCSNVDSVKDCILILDAYDEISYASQGQEQNAAYLRKLEIEFDSTTLIITSRTGYIKDFPGRKFHMAGFSSSQRRDFLNKYNSHKPHELQLSDEYIDSLTQDEDQYSYETNELLSIPMLLYLIVAGQIDISVVSDRFTLYETVFGSDPSSGVLFKNRKITKVIWRNLYQLASDIAHSMYMENQLYTTKNAIIQKIESMELDQDMVSMLKNRFGIEIYLKGKDNQLFTFIHKSIYEFFAAKWICSHMRETLLQWVHTPYSLENVIRDMNTIFNTESFDLDVFMNIMENVVRAYFDAVFQDDEQALEKLDALFMKLIRSQICIHTDTKTPFAIRFKNMLLWVYDFFSCFLGRLEAKDSSHWFNVEHEIIRFLIKAMDQWDYLLLTRLDLTGIFLEKVDFGNTHFIDCKLTNADFSWSFCSKISTTAQHFDNMNMRQCDFYKNSDLSDCTFDNTELRFADFRKCVLESISFRGSDLRGAYFDDAILENCDFTDSHIMLSDFDNAELINTSLDVAVVHDEDEDPNEDL